MVKAQHFDCCGTGSNPVSGDYDTYPNGEEAVC